ncbi:unnamed protein product [Caenorhabditis sp. 36 PRJEB53466]|nr:unnamed protein product [Caenorhabditis sp. 36 PRJEB53466]
MCIGFIKVAKTADERYKLILLNNRDEVLDRPTAPMHWHNGILSGVDEQDVARGTWLGMDDSGKIGMLLSITQPRHTRHSIAPSRGGIVNDYLSSKSTNHFFESLLKKAEEFNGFQFVGIEKNTKSGLFEVRTLTNQLVDRIEVNKWDDHSHVYSNSPPHVPFKKTEYGQKIFAEKFKNSNKLELEEVFERLFEIAQDRTSCFPDEQIRVQTGFCEEDYKPLTSIFVRFPESRRYGTRVMATKRHQEIVVTRDAIEKDTISAVAAKYWAPFTKENHAKFDAKLVDTIYENEMLKTEFNARKIMMLEFSQYLEGYLWPNYHPEYATKAYNLSIIVMVNEKFRERTIDAWSTFTANSTHFPAFFHKILELALDSDGKTTPGEQCAILTFLVNAFASVEQKIVHDQTKKLVSIEIWAKLLPEQRADLFKKQKKVRKIWENVEKRLEKSDEKTRFEREFLWNLIEKFKKILKSLEQEEEEGVDLVDSIRYCEKFMELMIDLESILQTRRFFNSVLHSTHLLTACILSNLISTEVGSLFCQLVQLLKFYSRFEIDDLSGRQLTHKEVSEEHYKNVTQLQKAAFRFFNETMKDFYLLNVSGVDTRRALQKQFQGMSHAEVYRFAEYLHLVPKSASEGESSENQQKLLVQFTKEHLVETITLHCERRPNQLTQLNEKPLFPTEQVIWDENVVPYEHYTGEGVLALDKLNLQFLTLHDYLLRNFNLFQLESTYEIRQDLEDVLFRMKPFQHESRNETVFAGWARMALPIDHFQITEVAKPLVGEKSPAVVRGVVSVNVGRRQDIRQEWENLRRHDVCFLVSCRSKQGAGGRFDVRKPFLSQIEVTSVRGCDVEGMLDAEGMLLEEFAPYEKKLRIPGDIRKFRLLLDPNQYRLDMEKVAEQPGNEDIYYSFNLLVRRDSKTNNFKAVLQTIRDLLNTECVVPDWLTDVILGYGEPDSAHYSKLSTAVAELDFNDTFLSFDHVKSSFPGYKVVGAQEDEKLMVPPFKLHFKDLEARHSDDKKPEKSIVVTPITRKRVTPYEYHPNTNKVQFTAAQIEAIKSGMQPGLTMVVGPPGTGKTDVAVQIISNLYHNWPNQRTLIVTHSNQALNQLFEKIIALDVDERHLLRMGHGEEALETEKDFSRYGRVNYVLKERIELLNKVEKLAKALKTVGDVAYTCENAGYFFRFSVCRAWEHFLAQVTVKGKEKLAEGVVAEHFPFAEFFSDIPHLFSNNNTDDLKVAHSCWRYIEQIFEKLDEFRAFELLRNGRDRTEYLLNYRNYER